MSIDGLAVKLGLQEGLDFGQGVDPVQDEPGGLGAEPNAARRLS
jgi:hypothetical protein